MALFPRGPQGHPCLNERQGRGAKDLNVEEQGRASAHRRGAGQTEQERATRPRPARAPKRTASPPPGLGPSSHGRRDHRSRRIGPADAGQRQQEPDQMWSSRSGAGRALRCRGLRLGRRQHLPGGGRNVLRAWAAFLDSASKNGVLYASDVKAPPGSRASESSRCSRRAVWSGDQGRHGAKGARLTGLPSLRSLSRAGPGLGEHRHQQTSPRGGPHPSA